MFEISSSSLHIIELIDTLWNVNMEKYETYPNMIHELIDTLWNVNVRTDRALKALLKN